MEITNVELTRIDIPNLEDENFWNNLWAEFALSFDGYAYAGGDGMTNLINLCEPITAYFFGNGKFPLELTLSDLRACLFLCQRFARNSGEQDLTRKSKDLILNIIDAIKEKVLNTQYYLYLERTVGKKTDEGYFLYRKHGWELDQKSVILGCLLDYKEEHSIWDIDEITEEEALRIINDIKRVKKS